MNCCIIFTQLQSDSYQLICSELSLAGYDQMDLQFPPYYTAVQFCCRLL